MSSLCATTRSGPDDGCTVGGTGTEWPEHCGFQVLELNAGQAVERADEVIEEVPVALVYNGISHAVMLVTPTDLEDFALGFSLGEGILTSVRELYDCECLPVRQGIECRMRVAGAPFSALKERRRTLAGRTGCGLCGVESLAALERPIVPVSVGQTCTPTARTIAGALAELPRHQPLFRLTGGGHAAAWVRADGEVRLVREDVGRHNALDKLIGALARAGLRPADGFVICTSRASYEMVQKAMSAGIGLLVAVSAPTASAIRLAQAAHISLIGFARGERMLVYTYPDAIRGGCG
ncbi:formate dehydrogenase accessory sulfurtransferase FdhD [uncultured Lamprocystis sp.]|uniref:formate dehydrogenase accessory sulfurtransferase FdhD n=1 Tax=uncultured Lamprocystis sp. TaxID=543132 RepID=UPI0025D513CB|nr:formate dehydrogenase accessory sulfurtransferase FdhD [uncultured Lamprocystis sp.]